MCNKYNNFNIDRLQLEKPAHPQQDWEEDKNCHVRAKLPPSVREKRMKLVHKKLHNLMWAENKTSALEVA